MRLFFLRACLALLLLPVAGFAQQIARIAAANRVIANADSFLRRMPIEKIFTHTDRPYYSNSDTIWLKNYVLNGLLGYSKKSGIVYAELVNDTGRVVMQQAMPVFTGVNWGQIVLDSAMIAEGNYTLRTYTNWMQNTGTESFYTRQLYIGNAGENNRRINAAFLTTQDSVAARLQLLEANGNPLRLHDIQLLLTGGRKTWLREKRKTDVDGRLYLDVVLPKNASTRNLTLIARDRNKKGATRQLVVPVPINRDANTDVQFMPEGGQLVAGLPSLIGFKAVGENSKGVDVKGVVLDSRKQQVAEFSSVYKGMGYFKLLPQPGEGYTAVVTLPGKSTKHFKLPAVKDKGVVLSVQNAFTDTALVVTIQISAGLPKNNAYSLTAQTGGLMCYASIIKATDTATTIRTRIAKSRFPQGVARFTLFTGEGQPLAERIVFIDHKQRLNINMHTMVEVADSTCVAIKVTGPGDVPVQGTFSVSVTDNEQVQTDSLQNDDIYSHLWLSSALKGYVENPAWYFANTTESTATALDNLLLTQGWVGYNWQDAFKPKYKPAYRAEGQVEISGTVVRLGKPQAGIPVMLISTKKPMVFRDTISDELGRFAFTSLPPFDTAAFVVEAKDKKGKIFKVNVELDTFTPPPTNGLHGPLLKPWYVNTDNTMLAYHQKNVQYQTQLNNARYGDGQMLQEVVITAKKMIKDSKNLNGDGNADVLLDEADIRKAGNVTLIELLYKQVKGFTQYKIRGREVKFVIDGVEVDFFYDSKVEPNHDLFLNFTLSSILASDVKGIEVMYNSRYIGRYLYQYDPGIAFGTLPDDWPAYIEITTWSGNGLFSRRNPAISIARPVPVMWPKQFYQPKYSAVPNPLTELRPTVYWNPDVVTDQNGNAEFVFFNKKQKTAYTIAVQGSNLNGLVGSASKTINAK